MASLLGALAIVFASYLPWFTPLNDAWATARGIDPNAMLAISCVETGGSWSAVGKFGEVTAYQVWPRQDWRPWTTNRPYAWELVNDPNLAVDWATRIFQWSLVRAGGDYELALAYYSGQTPGGATHEWYIREFYRCYWQVLEGRGDE